MTFKTQMADDAVNVFLNEDDFAESIEWLVAGLEPGRKTISAIVDRGELNSSGFDDADVLSRTAIVSIANRATGGVTSVTPGSDTAEVVMEEGKAAVSVRVLRILESDAGIWRIEVVK